MGVRLRCAVALGSYLHTGTTHRHQHRRVQATSPTHGHTTPAGLIPDEDDQEEEKEDDSKDYVQSGE